MTARRIGLGVLAAAAAIAAYGVAPASAEFFGCKEPHTKVTYSPGYFGAKRSSNRYTHEFAAQRSRHAQPSYRRQPDRWR